jgi:hypothetical protein
MDRQNKFYASVDWSKICSSGSNIKAKITYITAFCAGDQRLAKLEAEAAYLHGHDTEHVRSETLFYNQSIA